MSLTEGERFQSQTQCCEKTNSKGVFGGVPIYNLVRSELWSYMIMARRFSGLRHPIGWGHCLLTEESRFSCSPSQGVHDRGHCTPVGAWCLTANQSAYGMTAKVGCKSYETKGVKEPVATMLEALVPHVTGTYLFWMATFYVCFLPFNFTSAIFLQGHIFTFSFNIIRNWLCMYEYQFYFSLTVKWHTAFKQVNINFDCVYPLQGQFWF